MSGVLARNMDWRCPPSWPPPRGPGKATCKASPAGRLTWNGGSQGRFCITGRANAEGACTMSSVTAMCTGPAGGGSAVDTTTWSVKAAVSGLEGTRA